MADRQPDTVAGEIVIRGQVTQMVTLPQNEEGMLTCRFRLEQKDEGGNPARDSSGNQAGVVVAEITTTDFEFLGKLEENELVRVFGRPDRKGVFIASRIINENTGTIIDGYSGWKDSQLRKLTTLKVSSDDRVIVGVASDIEHHDPIKKVPWFGPDSSPAALHQKPKWVYRFRIDEANNQSRDSGTTVEIVCWEKEMTGELTEGDIVEVERAPINEGLMIVQRVKNLSTNSWVGKQSP